MIGGAFSTSTLHAIPPAPGSRSSCAKPFLTNRQSSFLSWITIPSTAAKFPPRFARWALGLYERQLLVLGRTVSPSAGSSIALAERTLIQSPQQLPDRLVEFLQAEELPVPQRRYDPAFDHLHSAFYFGLVAGFVRTRPA